MFGLFGGIQLKIIIAVALLGIATTGYFYVQSLRHELQASLEAQQKLADTVDAQQKVMDSQKKDIEKMQVINKKMNEDFAAANREMSALEKKFKESSSGQQRNFNALAIQNPQSIEEKVNRGTKYALRCNELATGSPIESDDEKNNICPDLVKKRKAK
jgi:predicted nuclease with TOPRIM domain